jgi:hypothetical protein
MSAGSTGSKPEVFDPKRMQGAHDLEFKIFREDIVVCPRDSSLLGVVEVQSLCMLTKDFDF